MIRCCTHSGELAAVGSMTRDGSPTAIPGWACKMPSKIHSRPKPIRSSRRQPGSDHSEPATAAPAACPASARRAVHRRTSRTITHATDSRPKISSAMSPWRISADRNAATTIGSLMVVPLRSLPAIPGTKS